MKYGQELIEQIKRDMEITQAAMENRAERINNGMTDIDDCFVSIRCDERQMGLCKSKIALLEDGGTAWFTEYATLDGQLVEAHWCKTKFGTSLRAQMPDGRVVWTTACTKKGLAKKGLKMVECLRPAWFAFQSGNSGMLGVYTGSYITFPSDVNYATGEPACAEPLEIRDAE